MTPINPKILNSLCGFSYVFLLKLHLDKKRNYWIDWLMDTFGQNDSLRNAVSRFSQGSVDDIEIVQGMSLLKLTD